MFPLVSRRVAYVLDITETKNEEGKISQDVKLVGIRAIIKSNFPDE